MLSKRLAIIYIVLLLRFAQDMDSMFRVRAVFLRLSLRFWREIRLRKSFVWRFLLAATLTPLAVWQELLLLVDIQFLRRLQNDATAF